jgi:hypothetical protein
MNRLKAILLSLAAASPVALHLTTASLTTAPAIASGVSQTLGQCVQDLNKAYPYRVDSEAHFNHVKLCQNTLSVQQPAESLGQCVKSLNDVYPYRADGETNNRHIQVCSNLLRVQQSNLNQPVQPPVQSVQPVQPRPVGGSPEAITTCMRRLMYERKLVCTRTGFPRCSSMPSEGFGGWQTQDVRTEISEAAAVQACQNAR